MWREREGREVKPAVYSPSQPEILDVLTDELTAITIICKRCYIQSLQMQIEICRRLTRL